MKAPFPWFGGKSRVAGLIWERFGDVKNFCEPFAGSLAVLLARPHAPKIETVNDADCYLANFWRATREAPHEVAAWCDVPVNEAELSARHLWLVQGKKDFALRVQGNPDYFDARAAGYWVYGVCAWIGSGFCSGQGPWGVDSEGRLCKIGNAGRGVNRKLPHLGDAGRGINRQPDSLLELFDSLAARLRGVRVACGNWDRICGPSVTHKHGLTGVFLDPPYSTEAGRYGNLYAHEDLSCAQEARAWAIAEGENPLMRIAFCGYEGEHVFPASWSCVAWKAAGGFGVQSNKTGRENCARERIWFSPHTLDPWLL